MKQQTEDTDLKNTELPKIGESFLSIASRINIDIYLNEG